ncbi:MAG: peptide deformylase [Candidatus Moraniibacteriota bacterium]|jgi:peptide deformylase
MLRHKKKSDNLNITHIGDAILNQQAEAISNVVCEETQTLIDKMFETMYAEKGVGLAAPQVNESKQIVTIDAEGDKFVFINPKITNQSDDMVIFPEGCLSVPGKELQIIRHKKVTVQYTDRDGNPCILKARDFLSIVCQHEIDHINGLLMTDRFEQQKELRESLNIT